MRKCTSCNIEKPLSEYTKDVHTKDGLRKKCRSCMSEYKKKMYPRYAESNKLGAIRRKYGLTPEQYEDMIKDGCNVCGSHDGIAIDHDHSCCPGTSTCGKCIRGTLCRRCNTAEGMFKDSPELLFKLFKFMVE